VTTFDGLTAGLLDLIIDAFNQHDLDGIMGMMVVGDCSMDRPRGQEPWG
jgi:hypothetical protein